MGFNKWMMKNSVGSPGSICKNFGKILSITKRNNPSIRNYFLFLQIFKERYPFMDKDTIKILTSASQDSFLLFVFTLTVYQNKGNLWALERQWGTTIEAIHEVAISKYRKFVDMDILEFSMKAEIIFNQIKHQI